MEMDVIAKNYLRPICYALGDTRETYQSIHEILSYKKVPGTGQWLLRDPIFMTWADQQNFLEPILCISGIEEYGKSHLMPTIVQFLRKRYSQGREDHSRTSVACYYFPKVTKGFQ